MIYELEKKEFYKCKDLASSGGNIEEKAIVEGTNPGRIFVDNADHPCTAMVWQGNLDGFVFIGDSNNELFNVQIKKHIDHTIIPQAKKLGLQWFECIGNHPNWDAAFQEMFNDRGLRTWNQNVYALSSQEFIREPELNTSSTFALAKITKDMVEKNSVDNHRFLKAKILEYWASTIVSLCISGFCFKNIHAVDIETLTAYRGNKLAQRVGSAFVHHCISNNLKPYWDCTDSNETSNVVARRVGLTKQFAYRVHAFKIS